MNLRPMGALLLLGLLPSCAVYEPKPIDLRRDTAEWLTVSQQLCRRSTALSAEDLHRIGLLLNPDLNKARLTLARSSRVSEEAGRWEDPSLSADAVRVLKENITNGGIGPKLTLPVTGLPALAKRIAAHYNEADYWKLRTAERDFLSKLDALRFDIMIAHSKLELMNARLRQLEEEKASIARLQELGEVEFADLQVASQRLFDTIKEQQELADEHLRLHRELIALLGLHPAVGDTELAGSLPDGVPALVSAPGEESLLRAPELRALMADYAASEDELRREIRKQYPEITLGPTWEREEGNNKIGFGVDLSLPLWNRNREAIATADADRALRGHELVSQWRSLVNNTATLSERQRLARQHCLSEAERLRSLQENGTRQEQLYALGESTLPALAEARHEIYQRRINYLDCLGILLNLQTQLRYLNPDFQA